MELARQFHQHENVSEISGRNKEEATIYLQLINNRGTQTRRLAEGRPAEWQLRSPPDREPIFLLCFYLHT